MIKKLNIGLIYGGKSGEHEVSLQSAKSIYENLDKNKYNVFLIGIDKEGRFVLGENSHYLLNDNNPKLIKLNKTNSTQITVITKQNKSEIISISSGKPLTLIDVFFPITHGTFGEDGSLQGFLELLDVAYVGAGVTGSAIGMDKDVQKRLLRDTGIPTANFFVLRKNLYKDKELKEIIKKLKFPFFVKPACLGSSVGINKVKNSNQFKNAIDYAFQYDNKILVEEGIEGREIECSVLGNDNPVASVPGEVIPQQEFYSYDAKYIDENGAILKIPAKLPSQIIKDIQQIAVKTYKTLECWGMARIDFFLKKNGEILVNEINTLPGFTKISMYPKLWEISGISYKKLLDKLIELALEKKRNKDKLKRSYG